MKMAYIFIVLTLLFLSGCTSKQLDAVRSLDNTKEYVAHDDINSTSDIFSGQTALHLVAAGYAREFEWQDPNNIEIMKYLIDHGANINALDDNQETPLHLSVQTDASLPSTKYLIERDADPTIKNIWDQTPLEKAKAYKAFQTARYLEPFTELGILKLNAKYLTIDQQIKKAIALSQEYPDNKKIAAYIQALKAEKIRLAEEQNIQEQKAVNDYLAKNDIEGLKNYTDTNPNAVYYIQDEFLRLALTGPKGMKVGDIRKLIKEGRSEDIIIPLIKRVKTPYKEFTLEEIDLLVKMGLSEKIIGAMIERTTKLLDDEKLRKQQEFLLSEQERIAKENAKTKGGYQNSSNTQTDDKGNPIVNKVQDELIRQGISTLLDHLF